tara:strand:+ start:235 stop:477 length:243 start_codon:yes stop_codon:yes gene_type:complete
MALTTSHQEGDRLFNNADSFAISFDAYWKKLQTNQDLSKLEEDEKIQITLEAIKYHPFIKEQPTKAIQIAKFRIRLLNLS